VFLEPSFSRSNVVLNAADGAESNDEAEEVAAEVTDDEPPIVEEEEVKEEVGIDAIKKETAELENTLKNKNRELDSIEKMADQYTELGYARKVAEMEEVKKSKAAASAGTKVVAKASVLQNFLPVVDEFKVLTAKYEEDEFAQKYSALSSNFNSALAEMGVAEYDVVEGDVVDIRRVTAVEEVHSADVAKGCVIKAVNSGYELDGNIMRMAEAAVSLGPEGEEEPAETEESAEE
jgi:molecular chaperone GrpE (heat shock protein)